MQHFLTPVLALILWTFIMWVVMYKRRIPAMNKLSKDPQKFIDDPDLWAKMPARATNAADNYNHLHEQPVIFYALMFYISLSHMGNDVYMYLAWAYVGIRVVHSLVHITTNKVMHRFSLFALGSVVLMIMGIRAAMGLF